MADQKHNSKKKPDKTEKPADAQVQQDLEQAQAEAASSDLELVIERGVPLMAVLTAVGGAGIV